MKKHKKSLIIVSTIIILIPILLLILSKIFYYIDYTRVQNKEMPIFCIEDWNHIADGGTRVFWGLNYKIIKYHKIIENNKYYTEMFIGDWHMNYDDNLPTQENMST